MTNSYDLIREQAMSLLVTIEHMPSFGSERGMGGFGLLVELIGTALQKVSRGERDKAHALVYRFARKIPTMFKDPTECSVVQRAFDEFALVLDIPPSDIAH